MPIPFIETNYYSQICSNYFQRTHLASTKFVDSHFDWFIFFLPSILLISLCFVAKSDKLLIVFFLIVAIQRINKLCHTEHRFTADISLKFNLVRNISWEVLVANNFHEHILNLEHARYFSLFYLRWMSKVDGYF